MGESHPLQYPPPKKHKKGGEHKSEKAKDIYRCPIILYVQTHIYELNRKLL